MNTKFDSKIVEVSKNISKKLNEEIEQSDQKKKQIDSENQSLCNESPPPFTSEHNGFFRQSKEFITTILTAVIVVIIIRCFLFAPFSIPSGSMIPNLLIGDNIVVNKFSYGYSRYSFLFSQPNFEGRIWYTPPKRGDVAVFRSTKPPYYYYVKRVIGLPGDTVQVKNSILYINGQEVKRKSKGTLTYKESPISGLLTENLYEEFLPDKNGKIVKYDILQKPEMQYDSSNYLPDGQLNVNYTIPYQVPKGYFFAMGDNRDHSADSRFIDPDNQNFLGYVPIQNLIGKVSFVFFSFDQKYAWWEFWYWPYEIRWNRLFKAVQ
ncbi:hypothetical protein COMNV_00072 [Commensalibacter sp. Nvir]|uniref:signal peptidase I n=1 Tax=Commensalibacter sp. Nvir TaxID=3069817 RepID=UPI002D4E4513|nr:hypothetical protein COMNV_00072 [Commensalibacter sp. Nvir]